MNEIMVEYEENTEAVMADTVEKVPEKKLQKEMGEEEIEIKKERKRKRKEGEWKGSKKNPHVFIDRGCLIEEAKVWFYFLSSVLRPSKHMCTVRGRSSSFVCHSEKVTRSVWKSELKNQFSAIRAAASGDTGLT